MNKSFVLITIYIKSALKIYVLFLYDVIRDQYSNGARTRTNEIASFILIILIREYYLLFRHDDNFDILHVTFAWLGGVSACMYFLVLILIRSLLIII